MKQLNRNIIFNQVSNFYKEIRKDDILGPIFNRIVTDWENHLELITDFWMNSINFKGNYSGNPVKKHFEVDKKVNHTISQEHFAQWLKIWSETCDKNLDKELAFTLKNKARKMSTMLFINIFQNR